MSDINEVRLPISLDPRQVAEIRHSLYYAEHLNHGTAGHNLLILIAELSKALGFRLAADNRSLFLGNSGQARRLLVPPDHVTIVDADNNVIIGKQQEP